jgi:uncharacterized protein YdeI (YjbR/CyaY-like superfamily)
MPKNKKVDEYILRSNDFAKPILNHLRKLIHMACPQVVETIKWGHPHFEYKGLLCNMAAFNRHCAFGFWKATLMKDAELLKENNADAMGHSGKIKSVSDLPKDKIIVARVKEAALLNEQGVSLPARKHSDKKIDIAVPLLLKKEFAKNKKAADIFNNLSQSHKREYIEWIDEAKTENTRLKRIHTTIEWLTEGKSRNWQYLKPSSSPRLRVK